MRCCSTSRPTKPMVDVVGPVGKASRIGTQTAFGTTVIRASSSPQEAMARAMPSDNATKRVLRRRWRR